MFDVPMVENPYIVIPDPKGGWNVLQEGSTFVCYHAEDKDAAVDKAREICVDEGADLFIHSADGTYRVMESYSED